MKMQRHQEKMKEFYQEKSASKMTDQQFLKIVAEKYDVSPDTILRSFYDAGDYEQYSIQITDQVVMTDMTTLFLIDLLLEYDGEQSIFEREIIDK